MMGEYISNWFAFEVKSLRHIMDFTIEPSFAKAVCFQVHEMAENFYQLFWNFGVVGREISSSLMEYVKLNKIDLKTLATKIFDSEDFADFVRTNASPIQVADLDADDMALINAVVNANWVEAKRRYGLDGHSYKIKIYGEQIREYEFWCHIYEEQKELIPLVDRLIEIAKLEPRICYEVKGVRNNIDESKNFIPSHEGIPKKIIRFESDEIVYEDGSKIYVRKEDIS